METGQMLTTITVFGTLVTLVTIFVPRITGGDRTWKKLGVQIGIFLALLAISILLVTIKVPAKFSISLHEPAVFRTVEIPNYLSLKLARSLDDDTIVLPFDVATTHEEGAQVYFYLSPGPDGPANDMLAPFNSRRGTREGSITLDYSKQLIWVPFSARELLKSNSIRVRIKTKGQQNQPEGVGFVVDERFFVSSNLWDVSADCAQSVVAVKSVVQCQGQITLRPQDSGEFDTEFSVYRIPEGGSPIADPVRRKLPYVGSGKEQSIPIPPFQQTFTQPGRYSVELAVHKRLAYLEVQDKPIAEKNSQWRDAYRRKAFMVSVVEESIPVSIVVAVIGSRDVNFYQNTRMAIRSALGSGSTAYSASFLPDVELKPKKPFTQTLVLYRDNRFRDGAVQIGKQLRLNSAEVLLIDHAPKYVPSTVFDDQVAELIIIFGTRANVR